MSTGSIIVDLLMRTGRFETDTKKAQKALRDFEKQAIDMGRKVGLAMAAVGTAAALLVKRSIDNADAMTKLAQQTGTTVESLSELTFAAALADVKQEELGASLVKLTKNMSDASMGTGEAIKAFDALGISVKNSDGTLRDSNAVFADIAEKFAGFADGAEKTALAVALFGRSGAQLIPLLNAGSSGLRDMADEARRLGVVIDLETGRAAEEFNDTLTRLGFIVQGFSNDMMRALLPSLQAVATWMVELRTNSTDAAGAVPALSRAINALTIDMARSAAQIYTMTVELAGFAAKATVILEGVWAAIDGSNTPNREIIERSWAKFNAISEAVKADVERARSQLARLEYLMSPEGVLNARFGADKQELARRGRGGSARGGALPPAPRMSRPSTGAGAASRGASDADKEAERIARERADARNREYDQINEFIRDTEEAERQRLKSLTASAKQVQFKEAISDIQFLNAAYEKGEISVDVWADAVRESTAALGEQAAEVDSFSKLMAENVQSVLGEGLAQAMEGNFEDIGDSFLRMLNRMVAEAIAADLARRLFGSDAKGGSGEGWIGAAMTAAAGFFGGAKAGGGDVMPGRSYLVGEQGPERFVPRSMGTILPAGAGPSPAGRSFQQTLNISVQGQVTARTAAQIGAEAGRALRRAERMNA